MAIGGSQREQKDFGKKVGLFEARVIAVNPNEEQYDKVLGIELKEGSKATEYLGESNDGNTYLRVDVWMEAVKSKENFRVSFFLENKERENKDYTKKQYINPVGACSWADDPANLHDWFKGTEENPKDYRVAFVGEEDLYHFLQTWFGKLDFRAKDTVLQLDWKKLMKGNVKELTDLIGSEISSNVVALATVITKERDEEFVEYQGVYNKAFLPVYALKQFRLVDYTDSARVEMIKNKKPRDMKIHEKFIVNVSGDYGCKDFFVLKELIDYNPEDNITNSDEVITEEGADY